MLLRLNRANTRIHGRLHQVPHVRRRVDPRQAGLVEPGVPTPVSHLDHRQLGVDALLIVEKARQLAHRQAVSHRHAKRTGEAERRLVEQRAFDLPAVDRVRPVEHHHLDAVLRRLLEHQRHRRHVGVEPRSDVLEVDHHRVDASQHLRRWLARRPIQRVDDQAGLLVLGRWHFFVENPADAVLGAEERDQRQTLGLREEIDGGGAVPGPAGVVGDEPDATALEPLEPLGAQDVDSGQHGSSRGGRRGDAGGHDGRWRAGPDQPLRRQLRRALVGQIR